MKRIVLSVLMLLIVGSMQAQRRKKPVVVEPELPKISLEEAIRTYDFPTAEQWVNHEIATLKKSKQPTQQQEEKLLWLRRAQLRLNAVERVTFVDSMVVPKADVLSHIHPSPECGRLLRSADYFHQADTMDCTVFQSEMGDQIFFSQAGADGNTHLYTQHLYGDNSMSEAQLLQGISDNDEAQNYPFMLTDGTTIYFAAKGSESLGGYDIFMSRYDADEHRFLAPENIGMPFNSPANDYLYVIDEMNNLGWFVTDRGMKDGLACIYVFIPNETRQVYVPEEVDSERLRRLARIHSIHDTQTDEAAVRGAQFRMREANRTQEAARTNEFDFTVTDNQIYHRKSDFRTMDAQQRIDTWLEKRVELEKVRKTLVRLRNSYHAGTPDLRTQLSSEILMLEESEETLVLRIKQEEKAIRKAELGL